MTMTCSKNGTASTDGSVVLISCKRISRIIGSRFLRKNRRCIWSKVGMDFQVWNSRSYRSDALTRQLLTVIDFQSLQGRYTRQVIQSFIRNERTVVKFQDLQDRISSLSLSQKSECFIRDKFACETKRVSGI